MRLPLRRQMLLIASLCLCAAQVNAQSSIRGILLDSLHNDVLSGAVVTLSPGNIQTLSDSSGRFTISGVAGTYSMSVAHPLLDSIGVSIGIDSLTISGAQSAAVALGVPSIASLRNTYCGTSTNAFLVGRVLKRNITTPAENARVVLDWYELRTTGKLTMPAYANREVRTNAAGYYAACNLPPDFDVSISAESDSLATPKVPISSTSILTLAPWLVVPSRSILPSFVSGVVVSLGRPLSGVVVEVLGLTSKAETDSSGHFTMTVPSVGSTMLRARKIGYVASVVSANIFSESGTEVNFELDKPSTALETVVIRARMSDVATRSGFTDRARRGFGRYILADEISRSRVGCVVDLLRRRTGVVTRGRGCSVNSASPMGGGYGLGFRGVESFYILPQRGSENQGPPKQTKTGYTGGVLIFVDGFQETPDPNGEVSLDWLNTKDVVGIELYPKAGSVAIAIWTTWYGGNDHGVVKPMALPVMW